MANPIRIETPRGAVFHTDTGTVSLTWIDGFGANESKKFSRAQQFIDSEVLRFCSTRVPFKTGMLQKSGILGTVVGSGEVSYVVPYSARQYYRTATTRPYDANRGAYWFERGKAIEKERIRKGALKLAGGL